MIVDDSPILLAVFGMAWMTTQRACSPDEGPRPSCWWMSASTCGTVRPTQMLRRIFPDSAVAIPEPARMAAAWEGWQERRITSASSTASALRPCQTSTLEASIPESFCRVARTDAGRLTQAMKREKKGAVVLVPPLATECKDLPDVPVVWDEMMPRRMDTPIFPGVLSLCEINRNIRSRGIYRNREPPS